MGDYYVYMTEDFPASAPLVDQYLAPPAQDQQGSSDQIPTFTQAMCDPLWHQFMQEEMKSIYQNNTWQLEDLPQGVRPITCRWVYRTKPGAGTSPDTRKARLVARGFEQKQGLDYQETFALVIKWVTIRSVVAVAATKR